MLEFIITIISWIEDYCSKVLKMQLFFYCLNTFNLIALLAICIKGHWTVISITNYRYIKTYNPIHYEKKEKAVSKILYLAPINNKKAPNTYILQCVELVKILNHIPFQ